MKKVLQKLMTRNYFMWVLFWTLICIVMFPVWAIICTLTFFGSCIISIYLEICSFIRTVWNEITVVIETYRISEYKKFKNEVSE